MIWAKIRYKIRIISSNSLVLGKPRIPVAQLGVYTSHCTQNTSLLKSQSDWSMKIYDLGTIPPKATRKKSSRHTTNGEGFINPIPTYIFHPTTGLPKVDSGQKLLDSYAIPSHSPIQLTFPWYPHHAKPVKPARLIHRLVVGWSQKPHSHPQSILACWKLEPSFIFIASIWSSAGQTKTRWHDCTGEVFHRQCRFWRTDVGHFGCVENGGHNGGTVNPLLLEFVELLNLGTHAQTLDVEFQEILKKQNLLIIWRAHDSDTLQDSTWKWQDHLENLGFCHMISSKLWIIIYI